VIECTTQPGDVLYLPPFWLHQTATIRRSVAVNIWSPSSEAQRAATSLSLLTGLHGALLGGTSPRPAEQAKEAALCVAARVARAVATTLAPRSPSELLTTIHAAQHAHLRASGRTTSARRADTASSATAATQAAAAAEADACAWSCDPPSAAEAASAQSIADVVVELPAGVAELTLADLVTELAEQVASAVPPVWRGDKGRARAVRCIALHLQRTSTV